MDSSVGERFWVLQGWRLYFFRAMSRLGMVRLYLVVRQKLLGHFVIILPTDPWSLTFFVSALDMEKLRHHSADHVSITSENLRDWLRGEAVSRIPAFQANDYLLHLVRHIRRERADPLRISGYGACMLMSVAGQSAIAIDIMYRMVPGMTELNGDKLQQFLRKLSESGSISVAEACALRNRILGG